MREGEPSVASKCYFAKERFPHPLQRHVRLTGSNIKFTAQSVALIPAWRGHCTIWLYHPANKAVGELTKSRRAHCSVTLTSDKISSQAKLVRRQETGAKAGWYFWFDSRKPSCGLLFWSQQRAGFANETGPGEPSGCGAALLLCGQRDKGARWLHQPAPPIAQVSGLR